MRTKTGLNKLEKKMLFINTTEKVCEVIMGCGIIAIFLMSGASDGTPLSTLVRMAVFAGLMLFIGLAGMHLAADAKERLEARMERRARMSARMALSEMEQKNLCALFTKQFGSGIVLTKRTGKVLAIEDAGTGSLNEIVKRWAVRNGIPYIDKDGGIWLTENIKDWTCVEARRGDNGTVIFYERTPVLETK